MRAASWQCLDLFAQVVDAGSISAAADRLGVAKSSVSTQIKSLEGELGIRLLSRSKSGVRTTESGLRMYEHAKRLLAHMDSAVEDVRAEESSPTGTLRISMPAGIADTLLIPALGRFLERYPKIRLDVQATDDLVELRQSGVDVALRFGWVRDGDFVAKKICQFRELLCASPAYLAPHPPIAAAADLSQHRWIGFTGFGGVQQTINMRDRAGRLRQASVSCHVRTSNAPSQKFWALAGAGVTRLPEFVIADELRAGTLVVVLEAFELDGPSLYAIHLAGRYTPTVVKALLAFLEADFDGFTDAAARRVKSPARSGPAAVSSQPRLPLPCAWGDLGCRAHRPAATAGRLSNHNPLDLIKGNLIGPAVVKPRRSRAFMVGHLLRDLELAAVAQVFGDAGGSEGMAPDLRAHLRGERPPRDHPVDIRLAHGAL